MRLQPYYERAFQAAYLAWVSGRSPTAIVRFPMCGTAIAYGAYRRTRMCGTELAHAAGCLLT
eukprot:3455865-Rhodomonas_salina.2